MSWGFPVRKCTLSMTKKLYLYIKVLSSCGEIVFGESAKLFFENEIKRIVLP